MPRNGSRKASRTAAAQIVGSVRFPVANPDFSAFIQAAKDKNPDAIYIWIPGGAQPAAVGKALAERGIDTSKIKVLGQDALGSESALKSMGDVGAWHHHGRRLRLQSSVADEPGIRKSL